MGLDNVAVQWPRTGRFYEPSARRSSPTSPSSPRRRRPRPDRPRPWPPTSHGRRRCGPAPTPNSSTCSRGLEGVLFATDAAAEDEDPVIDPDGCAWIVGGRSGSSSATAAGRTGVRRTRPHADRLAKRQLRWLDRDRTRDGPSTATRRSGTSPCWSSASWPASTAAAPTAASPSTRLVRSYQCYLGALEPAPSTESRSRPRRRSRATTDDGVSRIRVTATRESCRAANSIAEQGGPGPV